MANESSYHSCLTMRALMFRASRDFVAAPSGHSARSLFRASPPPPRHTHYYPDSEQERPHAKTHATTLPIAWLMGERSATYRIPGTTYRGRGQSSQQYHDGGCCCKARNGVRAWRGARPVIDGDWQFRRSLCTGRIGLFAEEKR